jgi:hypothetical protein
MKFIIFLMTIAISGPVMGRAHAPTRHADVQTILLNEFRSPSRAALAGAEWYKFRMRHCPVRILSQTLVVGDGGYRFEVRYVPLRRCLGLEEPNVTSRAL